MSSIPSARSRFSFSPSNTSRSAFTAPSRCALSALSGLVLLAFLVGGQVLLETLGLRLGSFQVAGGILVVLFAMAMIFGVSKPLREIEEAKRDPLDGAVLPLAMPSIARPARCWPS